MTLVSAKSVNLAFSIYLLFVDIAITYYSLISTLCMHIFSTMRIWKVEHREIKLFLLAPLYQNALFLSFYFTMNI